AIQAAFRLRPDAGEAHLARAWNLYHGYLDYDSALAELEIARQSLPNNSEVFELTAYIQRRQARWEESTRNLAHAIELDPRTGRARRRSRKKCLNRTRRKSNRLRLRCLLHSSICRRRYRSDDKRR